MFILKINKYINSDLIMCSFFFKKKFWAYGVF